MNETIRKFILYVQPTRTYWELTKGLKSNVDTKIDFYPLSILPRIEQGHYKYMDKHGIPQYPNKQGVLEYHYTTLCSYTLGVWEKYLLSPDSKLLELIIRISDYLVEHNTLKNGVALFLDSDGGNGINGAACAMNQGEAISVLIRAHELSNDEKYLQLALAAAQSYKYEYGSNGITKVWGTANVLWYQEAGQFILNGHNYALWGLWELYNYTKDKELKKMFDQGIKSLEHILPHFDCHFWSLYRLDKPEYIASMMYHNLHIVQLEHLGEVSNSKILKEFSIRFSNYAKHPVNRIKNSIQLFKSKLL